MLDTKTALAKLFTNRHAGYQHPVQLGPDPKNVDQHRDSKLSPLFKFIRWFCFRLRSLSIRQWVLCLSIPVIPLLIMRFYNYEPTPLPYKLYFPPDDDPIYAPINRTVYLTWVGTTRLRAVGLATIDSIARHLPHWKIEVHFTKEVGLPDDLYPTRKRAIDKQINYFKNKGVSIRSIIHEDISTELKGTLFDGLGIKQEHVAGVYGVKAHWTFGAHAADLLRSIYTLPGGGMYMDEDNIVLADFEPLLERYGQTVFMSAEWDHEAHTCKDFTPQNGWYTITGNHPFMLDVVERQRQLMLDPKKGPDCLFAYKEDLHQEQCGWTTVGPVPFWYAHYLFCDINPPQIINYLPDDLLPPHYKLFSNTTNDSTSISTVHPSRQSLYPVFNRHPIYTIITRKYLMPGHWREGEFLINTKGDEVMEHINRLATAYQFHVFAKLKDTYHEVLRNGTQYPVMQVVHRLSCKHLCDPNDYVPLLDSSVVHT